MTAEEILHKHISKECMDELSENVWPDMLDAMEEYAKYYNEQRSKKAVPLKNHVPEDGDIFDFECDSTGCCGVGPITTEKYCPECGTKIDRQ